MLIGYWRLYDKLEVFGLAAWLCFCVVRQLLRPVPRWFYRLDYFRVLPGWHLFAPRVHSYDYKLFIRDHHEDGSLSQWLDFTPLTARRWWTAMWNPSRRIRKAFFSDTRGLVKKTRVAGNPQRTREYKSLARYALMCRDAKGSSGRQFILTASREHDESPERLLVFKSDFIPLTGNTSLRHS